MYDVSADLLKFYNEHVRLGSERRSQLAGFRDINLQRLKDGLDELGAERQGTPYPHFCEAINQGSYAMHTLNQADGFDYDIDVGVVFDADALPADAAAARARVQDALRKKATGFTKEPEARKNAVTIWYADGYHVDFAVYRLRRSFLQDVLEHAGAEGWVARDPRATNSWFERKVDELSPKDFLLFTPKVEPKQLRRIVRLVKAFARSRSGWSLPGGMILTALVCEVYRPHNDRDDVSLYMTLNALAARLATSKTVRSPIHPHAELTASPKRAREVERLYQTLLKILPKMAILQDIGCARAQALEAWNSVFNHAFWSSAVKAVAQAAQASLLQIECGLARRQSATPFSLYQSNSKVLPKDIHLRFRIKATSVPVPYQVKWTVMNEGDEATEAQDLTRSEFRDSTDSEYWTRTAYKGRHRLKCEIFKDGAVQETATFGVRVAGRV